MICVVTVVWLLYDGNEMVCYGMVLWLWHYRLWYYSAYYSMLKYGMIRHVKLWCDDSTLSIVPQQETADKYNHPQDNQVGKCNCLFLGLSEHIEPKNKKILASTSATVQ